MKLHELKELNKREELIREINEMAFFIGLEANEGNAVETNAYFNLLAEIKDRINGHDPKVEQIHDNIVDLAFYLGSIITEDNAPFVSDSISTLYDILGLVD